MRKLFSVLNAPLDGIQLIEASAGTGKTYTISSLVVRLILEKALAIHQILVVTYTRAATEELKLRIWRRLQEVRRALEQGIGSTDAFVDAMVHLAKEDHQAPGRIDLALADFDRAAIFTIHGFCQRVLQEHAFETGSPYEASLVTDPSAILQEVADDFWRLKFYPAPAEFLAYALSKKRVAGPRHFTGFWGQLPPPPFRIDTGPDKPALSRLQPYRQVIRQLRRQWREEEEQIVGLLNGAPLNGRLYGTLKPVAPGSRITAREVRMAALAESMTRFSTEDEIGFPLFEGFEKFTRRRLIQATAKSKTPPMHPFFDACDRAAQMAAELEAEFESLLRHLHAEFADFAQRRLTGMKETENILFYDDLLTVVRDSLYEKKYEISNRLTFFLKQKYKAALVDEFQDTDPIQYDIFKALFGGEDSLFCMIGDPKQSIYSFRGADIFAYMEAAPTAGARHTLAHNWRSQARMIQAVNTLFDNTDPSFIYEQIPFEPSRPGAAQPNRYRDLSAGLHLWYLLDEQERKLPKTDAIERILEAVAVETVRLAFNRTPVVPPNDIAVLVRTNRQARMMKAVFSRHGIPAVIHSTGNVFDTPEAADLKRFLSAVLEPTHERRLRAALVSNLLGLEGPELLTDSNAHNAVVETQRLAFQQYQLLWRNEGLMTMFRRFFTEQQVRSRLLSQPDGERKLTNLLHLTELLHEAAGRDKLNPRSLVRWLGDRINRQEPQDEEHLLRLEKDDAAVSIVTVHKSKGLEYEIVLCPFAWEGIPKTPKKAVIYHDDDSKGRKVVDLGSPEIDFARLKATTETMAESLRLLYVAVTRARTRCYVVWGRINTAETSALAYLLHPEAEAGRSADPVKALKTHMDGLDNRAYVKAVVSLADRSDGTIEPMPLAAEAAIAVETLDPAPPGLSCRRFKRTLEDRWDIASYSSIATHHPEDTGRDRDGAWRPAAFADFRNSEEGPAEPPRGDQGLYAFPRGTGAGLFFHDLLEHLDFAEPPGEDRRRLIAAKLTAHGFDEQWRGPIEEMITQLTAISLRSGDSGPTLAAVDRSHRISEMAFTFALKPLQSNQISTALATDAPERLPVDFLDRLQRMPNMQMRGFMKGYIDLVFKQDQRYYLVDWKSNYLGPRLQDYHHGALLRVMSEDTYYLQAYLYALALNRYLKYRDPGYRYKTDFGGVFYIFIRGLDAERGSQFGIVEVNPGPEAIERLETLMMPERIS